MCSISWKMSNSTGTTTSLRRTPPPHTHTHTHTHNTNTAPHFQARKKHSAPFPHLKVCPRRLHQCLCPHATNSRLSLLHRSVKGQMVRTDYTVDSATAARWKTYHVFHLEVPSSNLSIRILILSYIDVFWVIT
jgi:hypothetical protein